MLPVKTPERSPFKRRPMRITQGQKQALIDNLQLEITERARKLRAQYALQAQSLRTRVELRVNRIPKNLRTAKMGELLLKYAELSQRNEDPIATTTVKPAISNTPKEKITNEEPKAAVTFTTSTEARGVKRTRCVGTSSGIVEFYIDTASDAMISVDKENESEVDHPIPNPKKRAKTAATSPSRQFTNPASVLSPKSSNSRTLPHSPIRPPFGSPQKPYLSRPASPLKPVCPSKVTSPAKAAALAATSTLANLVGEKLKPVRAAAAATLRKASKSVVEPKAPSARPKRGATHALAVADSRAVSSSSNVSGTSTGTTVVKLAAKAPPATKAGGKKGVGISTAGKKVAAAKAEVPPAGRRVLRKRA
ncbi:hypothetical protein MMC13_002975 [Lambiella insularis]|nr:hypothetical protein [Lambiella insularis]